MVSEIWPSYLKLLTVSVICVLGKLFTDSLTTHSLYLSHDMFYLYIQALHFQHFIIISPVLYRTHKPCLTHLGRQTGPRVSGPPASGCRTVTSLSKGRREGLGVSTWSVNGDTRPWWRPCSTTSETTGHTSSPHGRVLWKLKKEKREKMPAEVIASNVW